MIFNTSVQYVKISKGVYDDRGNAKTVEVFDDFGDFIHNQAEVRDVVCELLNWSTSPIQIEETWVYFPVAILRRMDNGLIQVANPEEIVFLDTFMR